MTARASGDGTVGKALEVLDRIAAFGGCVVFNQPVDKATAELVAANYLEVVAAPDYEEGTLDILKQRANLRIIRVGRMDRLTDYRKHRFLEFKSLMDGGVVVQQSPLNAVTSIDDFQPAFDLMESGQSGKVILNWN